MSTPNHNISTKERIKTSTYFAQFLQIEIEQLKEKTKVYNLNSLGYHTYVVGINSLIVHNDCRRTNDTSDYKIANRGRSNGVYEPRNLLEQFAINDAKNIHLMKKDMI